MKCKVEGCDRGARYKAACLCQKHYFRIRRNGHIDIRKAKSRIEDDRGYQYLRAPGHPLLTKGQVYVSEQRIVLYAAIGPGPMVCELCGCGMTWKTCQVDHIDENPRNNERSNLRPLCRRCNTRRGISAPVEWSWTSSIEFDGRRMTAAEWARDPRVNVSGTTILRRKRDGQSDEQALFGRKVTHNGSPPTDNRPRKTRHKHERANAVAITVNGITMTAAEWSRAPGVTVTEGGIIWRVRNGWSPMDAVFMPPRPKRGMREAA